MSNKQSPSNLANPSTARQYRKATVETKNPRDVSEARLAELQKGDRLCVSGKNGAMFVLEVA